jgi:hypothetical protein
MTRRPTYAESVGMYLKQNTLQCLNYMKVYKYNKSNGIPGD